MSARTRIGVAVLGLLLPVVVILGISTLLAAPSADEAAEIVYGDLLHYEHLHGVPHVVFHHRDRVYFDHLKRDYKYTLAATSPGWVLTGLWYFIPATDEPASVGVARCTGILGEECDKSTELFGQINSPEIVTLEVDLDGEWNRFPVAEPGYAVRLDGFSGIPSEYRWLDDDDAVVYAEGPVQPLRPGRSQ